MLRYQRGDPDWVPPTDNIDQYGAYWRLRTFVHRVRRSTTALAAALQQRLLEVRRMLPVMPLRMRVTNMVDAMTRGGRDGNGNRGRLAMAQRDYRQQLQALVRRMQRETMRGLMNLVEIQVRFKIRREQRMNQIGLLIARLIERAGAAGQTFTQRFGAYDQARTAALRLPPSQQEHALRTVFLTQGATFARLRRENMSQEERNRLVERASMVAARHEADMAALR